MSTTPAHARQDKGNAAMTELLSCPCCAGDLTLHDTDWCEPIEYFARCDACGLHFPGSIDRQAAITIANRRPARDARANPAPTQELYVVQQLRKQYAQQYKDEYASEVIRVYEQERFEAADLIERLQAAAIEECAKVADAEQRKQEVGIAHMETGEPRTNKDDVEAWLFEVAADTAADIAISIRALANRSALPKE